MNKGVAELVGASREADLSFEEFFADSYPRVLGLVVLTTGDSGAAEDACQEAFARTFTRWAHVSQMDRPEAWVVKVALRQATDSWRKARREHHLDDAALHPETNDVHRLWIRWGLKGLTPIQRRAILLRYRHGMSDHEVAEMMGRSPAAVRYHLQVARDRLRRLFRAENER